MENQTQHKLLDYAENLGLKLHTEGNKEIFSNKIPDAWYIDEGQRLLLIFECKQQKSQWKTQAKAQLQEYCNIASSYANSHNLDIIPVFVYGTETIELYSIFDFNSPFETEFKELYLTRVKTSFNFDPHQFNQYIYDNFPTISSDERLKIIVSVLLTKSQNVNLSPPLFLRVLETESRYNMEEHFKFISEEPYNKCVDKMFEFLENVPNNKVLDVLYTSFVEISKWSFKGYKGAATRKNLTQTEGAVLTPPDIVSLMVNSLNINAADVVCDPCCGTGNFLIESLKYTQRIKGNELNLTRAIIARHGLIISNIEPNVENLDCMLPTYTPSFDYLLLNPPYDHKKEQEICIKFMELSKKGGAIIIPSSNFRDDNFMSKIQTICHPLKLIQLNNKVFYPVASVVTSVLIYSKIEKETLYPLQYYDFTDDGYKTQIQHGRVFVEHKEPILIQENNTKNNNEEKELSEKLINSIIDDFSTDLKQKIKEKSLKNYINMNFSFMNIIGNFGTPSHVKGNKEIILKDFQISELFEYLGRGNVNINKTNSGIFPLISSQSSNNGIVKYINSYKFEGLCLTVASNGSVGSTFVQNGKFNTTGDVIVLKPKTSLKNYNLIAFIMTQKFSKKYNWSYKLTKERLLSETIKLPTINDCLSEDSLNGYLFELIN